MKNFTELAHRKALLRLKMKHSEQKIVKNAQFFRYQLAPAHLATQLGKDLGQLLAQAMKS